MDNAENMVLALKALSWCKCTFKSEPGGLKERSSEMNTDRKSIRAYNNMIKDFPWLWAIMPIQHHEYTNIIVDYAEESIFNTSFLKNTTMSCDTWIKTSTEGRHSKVKQIEYFNDKRMKKFKEEEEIKKKLEEQKKFAKEYRSQASYRSYRKEETTNEYVMIGGTGWSISRRKGESRSDFMERVGDAKRDYLDGLR